MARNAEKAQSMLSRFREAQAIELGLKRKNPGRRPWRIEEMKSLRGCEKFRIETLREISKKVSQIQNPALSEYQIRDLNDEINKLLHEKDRWQRQIIVLGGTDYFKTEPPPDLDSKEVPGGRGYKYFGRAKDLPGVRELFEQEAAEAAAPKKSRHQLITNVDADYYGYRDDEDGVLVELEREAEREARARPVVVDTNTKKRTAAEALSDEQQQALQPNNIPSQQQVADYLLDRRKRELLDRYVSPDLREQEVADKALLAR